MRSPFQFETSIIKFQSPIRSPGSKSKKRIETKMANVSSQKRLFLVSLLLTLFQIQTKVFCYQYKVGDLDAWGIPTSANPQIYAKWSKYHNLTLGDSLCKYSLVLIFPFPSKATKNDTFRSSIFVCLFLYKLMEVTRAEIFVCMLFLCSVFIPTKSRFSNSSDKGIL